MTECHDEATPSPSESRPIDFHRTFTIALIGNPNAGKTTLFNALTGLRAKTANFPGTTVERRIGRVALAGRPAVIVDLPGLYSLDMDAPDARLTRAALRGEVEGVEEPDAILLVLDATALERNLVLASEALEIDRPVVAALNMIDMAEANGVSIDAAELSRSLGCPVAAVSALNRRGLDALRQELAKLVLAKETPAGRSAASSADRPVCGECRGCGVAKRFDWSEGVAARVKTAEFARSQRTDALDRVFTHPVAGVVSFTAVMGAVFALIFWAAQIPMDLIDRLFVGLGAIVAGVVPDGDLRSLLVDGVIGGVGGVLVFLPQIAILFFALALLEDTGYLSRAALVMDRVMRRLGLPGKAFVPLLSAHACAVPAIMSTRVIESPRDRLVTILVAPLMTCSARIPVYAMVAALVFPSSPIKASALFVASYAVGILASLGSAMLLGRTVAKGGAQPLVIELPPYRRPSLRSALLQTWDRAAIFVRQAGTIILAVSLSLWALSNYPKSDPPARAEALAIEAGAAEATGDAARAEALRHDADRLSAQHALQNSFAGRIGRAIEPALRPLGYDWQIGIGILSSFVAREVIVSTLAIVYGVGEGAADDNAASLYDTMRRAARTDGTPVFSVATSMSLLVFYILAAQCMSTTAVVKRETGTWTWPVAQIVYMTSLAYVAALATFQGLKALGYA